MADYTNLCMNCMSDMAGKTECPFCGHHRGEPQMQFALPTGTMLQKRYIVGMAKKASGEGLTYIGYDTILKAPIELHEFFPQSISERTDGGVAISVRGGSEIAFNECYAKFLTYFREIAHMRELSVITQIYDIFEENHTAYIVSEWNDSITLRFFVERSGGSLNWNTARQMFMPVLSALSVLHAHSIRHLGISPDTLSITKEGKMKLGGFAIETVRLMDTDLPPDISEGCAAIEQYVMNYTPNEATDVYGFTASLFYTLTGALPPGALKRRSDPRLLIPTSLLQTIPPHVVTAMANALQVSPDKRTPTFERLRAELSSAPVVTAALEENQHFEKKASKTPVSAHRKKKRELPGFIWVLASCCVMLIVFTAIEMFWVDHMNQYGQTYTATADPLASGQSSTEPSSKQARGLMAAGSTASQDMINTPSLVGSDYKQLLADVSSADSDSKDYQILLSSRQFSDTVPEGCIISQQPQTGTQMIKGTAVVVVVSDGAAVRTLPEISGKSLAEASDAVTSAGFIPTPYEQYSDAVQKDKVIGYKDVKEKSQMGYGAKVVIVVSLGPQPDSSSSLPSAGG